MWLTQLSVGIVALSATSSAIGLHGAVNNPLQVTPSFSGDGITLHPGWAPGHDPDHLDHLRPGLTKTLHYGQEGHRHAVHGAKHASLEANFTSHAVVLDHSTKIQSITCDASDLQICFKTPEALQVAEESWSSDMILVTYHPGCGDEGSGKRSFFRTTRPITLGNSRCADMGIIRIEEEKALNSGVVTWGTYRSSDRQKRSKSSGRGGHLSVAKPSPIPEKTDDITTDQKALHNFFNNPDIDTSNMSKEVDYLDFMPVDGEMNDMESTEMGGTALSKRSHPPLKKRFIPLVMWLALTALSQKIVHDFIDSVPILRTAHELISKWVIATAKQLMVPFLVPFTHSIHYDVAVDLHLEGQSVSNKPPTILGIGNGFTLAKTIDHGAELTLQCVKCGIHADFNIDGRLAFSIEDGVSEGFVDFVNNDPFTLDAVFGITVHGNLASEKWTKSLRSRQAKQIAAVPFSPLTIPGIITLGPQASLSVAFEATLEGTVEFILGGQLEIDAGTARVSVKEHDSNLSGLGAHVTPVFRASGNFKATGDLGLPFSLECGIDVLNGKFKKTIGVVNTPSVYVQAKASFGETSDTCPNGVEVRAGAKNRIHAAALDVWDYDLLDTTLYEGSLGCVTANGWVHENSQGSMGVINEVNEEYGGYDTGTNPPELTDLANRMPKPETKNAGFRIVMDGETNSILASGTDGGIYLIDRDSSSDISSPFGTTDLKHNTLMMDVFGRLIAYKGRTQAHEGYPGIAEVRVVDPHHVPEGFSATSIAELDTPDPGKKFYGIPYRLPQGVPSIYKPLIAYTTFCQTNQGLRLFMTRDAIDKDGNIRATGESSPNVSSKPYYENFFRAMGLSLSSCRSIQLTSNT